MGESRNSSSRSSRRERGGRRRRDPLPIRHPRAVLLGAVVALVAFAVMGIGVEDKLKPSDLRVPGTESERASELLRNHFGDSAPFAVLLSGPTSELDRQGPNLILALRENEEVTTVSPWDRGGGVEQLRPTGQEALIIVDFHVPVDEAVGEMWPLLEETIDEEVNAPVEASSTGYAKISGAIQDESIESTHRAEMIAVPILLIVLLLVFRSPIAAAIPLVFGAVTVLAGRGAVNMLTGIVDFDAFALSAVSMMGLALGVDYSLLMVSRFREELAAGFDPRTAALTTRMTAGRTTMFAGSTLFIATVVCAFSLPGALLVSLSVCIAIVTLLSVLVASVLGPALLLLLGPNVDRWHMRGGEQRRSGFAGAVRGALRHPRLVAAMIGLFVLVLAAPAIALETGPPSTEQLPESNPARQEAQLIEDTIGPGWSAPFIVVAEADKGSMTSKKRLGALQDFQNAIAQGDGIEAVLGPGEVQDRVEPLRGLGNQIFGNGTKKYPGLASFAEDLGQAAEGVQLLRGGLNEAASGASLIAGGSGRAQDGSELLANGLERARVGAIKAEGALARFQKATRLLANGQDQLVTGMLGIKFSVDNVKVNLRKNTRADSIELPQMLEDELDRLDRLDPAAEAAKESLQDAFQDLQNMGAAAQADPLYPSTLQSVRDAIAAVTGKDPVTNAPFAPKYEGFAQELAAIRATLTDAELRAAKLRDWLQTADFNLADLRKLVIRVDNGAKRLRDGAKRLADGAEAYAGRAAEATVGVTRLGEGAARLSDGIAQLEDGIAQLADGLGDGYNRSQPLEKGLDRADIRLTTQAGEINRLQKSSPGLFDSDYFVLSALEGSPPEERERLGQAVDIDRGGQAARILVIPEFGFDDPGAPELKEDLRVRAAELAKAAGGHAGVAGGAAELSDYDQVTSTRVPIVIAVITLLTYLALVVILRALILPAIAVILNLVTVAAAFGVLTLLFEVPSGWPLGGRTYVDTVGAAGIFGVVFGLSIDYAVFLLMRMRESYDRDGDNDGAIAYGLEKTAGVITGAAAIMAGVFIAFAAAPIATVSQLGVGLTVAVLLDATVIRLVLLPVLMHLIGDRVWWLPNWLEERLPRLNIDGEEVSSSAEPKPA